MNFWEKRQNSVRGRVLPVTMCLLMLFCAAAGAAVSGCAGRDGNSTVYEADNVSEQGGSAYSPSVSEDGSGGSKEPVNASSGGTHTVGGDENKTDAVSASSDAADNGEGSGEGFTASDADGTGVNLPFPTASDGTGVHLPFPTASGGIPLPNLPSRPSQAFVPTLPDKTPKPSFP
ncbi:MAG: hypothetical protein NC223_03635, partial [Butyrivibrio sp.]|nr:hypothetical protein [Butyrivibrio sp.]